MRFLHNRGTMIREYSNFKSSASNGHFVCLFASTPFHCCSRPLVRNHCGTGSSGLTFQSGLKLSLRSMFPPLQNFRDVLSSTARSSSRLHCRTYIVLPSSFSELTQFITDCVKSLTGLSVYQSSKQTPRRLVLLLRDKKNKTSERIHARSKNVRRKLQRSRVKGVLLLKAKQKLLERKFRVTREDMRLHRVASRLRSAGEKIRLHRVRLQGNSTRRVRGDVMVHRARRMIHRARIKATRANLQTMLTSRALRRWHHEILDLRNVGSSSRFDDSGYPLTSRSTLTGRFINPWCETSCEHQSLSKLVKWRLQRMQVAGRERIPESRGEFIRKTWRFFSKPFGAPAALSAGGWLRNLRTDVEHNYPGRICKDGLESRVEQEGVQCRRIDEEANKVSPHVKDRVQITWIGHSTCLVRMHDFTLLTDPVFSERIGPLAPYFGVKRFTHAAYTVDEIGSRLWEKDSGKKEGIIDAVLISHDHYDHLDYESIHQLINCDKVKVKWWCVPLGIKKWLVDNFGFSESSYFDSGACIDPNSIHEMEWWESSTFFKNGRSMKISCAPAQHWCSRTPFDRNLRLWCSWAVRTATTCFAGADAKGSGYSAKVESESPGKHEEGELSFYFGGDTGFPANSFPLHRQIGDRLGPFHLSALPIGAYKPSFFMKDSHVDPGEAWVVHNDLRSARSMAMHWGTFPLSDEPFYDPPARLLKATNVEKDSVIEKDRSHDGRTVDTSESCAADSFFVVRHGDTIESDDSSAPIGGASNSSLRRPANVGQDAGIDEKKG